MKTNPNHQLTIDLWVQAFEQRFKLKYLFAGGRDGRAVKQLLALGLTPEQIVRTAERAWSAPQGPKFWNCNNRASTLSDFAAALNKINIELLALQPVKPIGAF